MFHLNADTSRSLTQCQYGVILGSVQPVDSQFGAGGPFHHRNIIFPPRKPEGKNTSPSILTAFASSTWGKCPGLFWCLLLQTQWDMFGLSLTLFGGHQVSSSPQCAPDRWGSPLTDTLQGFPPQPAWAMRKLDRWVWISAETQKTCPSVVFRVKKRLITAFHAQKHQCDWVFKFSKLLELRDNGRTLAFG